MSHTKCKWKVERNFSAGLIIVSDEDVIAKINDTPHNPLESDANAKLIAAAPELLEALTNLSEMLWTNSQSFENKEASDEFRDLADIVDTAINKATRMVTA